MPTMSASFVDLEELPAVLPPVRADAPRFCWHAATSAIISKTANTKAKVCNGRPQMLLLIGPSPARCDLPPITANKRRCDQSARSLRPTDLEATLERLCGLQAG